MTGQSRIRISLGSGELEVEGSDEFVGNYQQDIRTMLDRLREQPVAVGGNVGAAGNGSMAGRPVPSLHVETGEFGEVFHAIPNSATGADQILVAGYFAAMKNSEPTFSTNEANRLLLEQGVKLSNPSQSLKNNLSAKRVFKVGNRFRVSQTGEQHIQSLIRH